jgi:hypothetical protein
VVDTYVSSLSVALQGVKYVDQEERILQKLQKKAVLSVPEFYGRLGVSLLRTEAPISKQGAHNRSPWLR